MLTQEVSDLLCLPNFVTVEDLSIKMVETLLKRAQYFKNGGQVSCLDKPTYCVNMFFENSTRTHTSFEMAERKLNITELPFNPSQSSVKKGETLYDTLFTMDAIGVDFAVIRHPENEYYKKLIDLTKEQHLDIGLINAGDGSGQHPSQSLLDMMTIYEQFGYFKGLKVAIVGDITNSRVAKSNMQLLTRLGAKVYFSGPKYWYSSEFDEYGQYGAVDEILPEMDAVILLRVQHERHGEDSNEVTFSAAEYHEKYGLNHMRYAHLKKNAIIMHPGPVNRGVEWADDLVEAPKSRFYTQMQNGVFVRMAMIEAVLRGRKLGGLE